MIHLLMDAVFGGENSSENQGQPQFTLEKLDEDTEDRRDDLKEMKSKIRRSWSRYQNALEKADKENGVDQLEAKAEAKAYKKAAKERQAVYKLLWKEYMSLKSLKIKRKQKQIIEGTRYHFDLSQVSTTNVEKLSEEYRETVMERQQKVEELQKGINSVGDEDVEIDFSDIEKDVRELEMSDVQFEIEADDGTVHEIEPEADW